MVLRAVDGAEGSSVEIEDEKVEDTVEEVKPLRKPIIKLGDVMGVNISSGLVFFLLLLVWI